LEAGKTVTFNNIGRCRMGKEKNIIFDPDENSNYLADAFGLPSFVSPAIKRETVRQRLEKQLTPKPSAPKEEKKINLRPVIGWAAGIVIPIAAAVLLYMYSPTIMDGLGNSYASFVPTVKFNTSEPAVKPGELNKNAEFADFRVIPEKLSEAPAGPEPEKAGEAIPEAVVISVIKKYQIVVGAFSKESNAERYVNELRGRNYDAGIIGKSSNGLTRVSISGFDAKKDALSMLRQVRSDENPSAWLLVIR
ncbi:MAG: SPOR domain-containing protein, partial [Bacteroidales bacterium]|nr:SPOR domain-containing protein [Bacteroidales bacterium]